MIELSFILIAIYIVVYRASRPNSSKSSPSRFRILIYSGILSMVVFGYSVIQANSPPSVDYFGMGWTWTIEALNRRFENAGNPNRIPVPGR